LATGQQYFELLYLFIDFIIIVLALSQPFLRSPCHRIKPAVTLSIIYVLVLVPNYALYIIYGNTGLTYSILLVLVHLIDLPPMIYLFIYLHKRGTSWLQHSNPTWLQQYGITKREEEILYLICAGKSNREISRLLFISLQTVKDHIYSIFRKTDVKNRVQLVNRFQNTTLSDQTADIKREWFH
jgi:DNA-binding CsgD family transcriptional regulator